jgi:hypothetical protein
MQISGPLNTTYTGCDNANSTVNSLTKRSGTKKKRCYAVTHINNKKMRDDTSKVTTAKVTCFGSRPFKKCYKIQDSKDSKLSIRFSILMGFQRLSFPNDFTTNVDLRRLCPTSPSVTLWCVSLMYSRFNFSYTLSMVGRHFGF